MEQQKIHSADKTLVVGLGISGMSVVRFLNEKGVSLAVTDSRDIPPGIETLKQDYPDVARFVGGFDERAFASAQRIVVSPGVALTEPCLLEAIDNGVSVIGDVELFAQHVDAPVIAITGSNGKSTVTTLVGEMAKACGINVGVGGNIGRPALDLLDKGYELYVLELSSFQLETIESLKPQAAVVLNISEDHMDRYRGLDDYAEAKARIYHNAMNEVVNLDDERVVNMVNPLGQVGFTLNEPHEENEFGICNHEGQRWLCRGNDRLIAADELLVPGDHNIANALAALALGQAAGLAMEGMLNALRRYAGLPHRTQYVAEFGGVKFFNDSKATNAGACIAALNGMDRGDGSKSIVILGGDCKDADFSMLEPVVEATCRAVVLIGRDADEINRHLTGQVPVLKATDLRDAVQKSLSQALEGDRVLLSPACASFDMFRGFEDRGEKFIKVVQELLR